MPFDGKTFVLNPGSQRLFVACPVFEALLEGTRGGGKTLALLADFASEVGKGWGPYWTGLLFRQTYPQLADVVRKSQLLFHSIFPPGHPSEARFNKSDYVWYFKTGESLAFRHMRVADDYWNYHGHEYPWIGFEELTNWPTIECYDAMKSCSRSIAPGMPRKYRSTANPWGVGHNWVKAYFVDPAPPGQIIVDPASGTKRVRLRSFWWENRQLMQADPEYMAKLQSIRNENKRRAWLEGDWNVTAGGIIDDIWEEDIHVVRPFRIPSSWRIDRSFDWGSSKPFWVGWWAESDGSEVTLSDGSRRTFPRGTLFLFAEWYGWNGQPNEGCRMLAAQVGRKIVEYEAQMAGVVYPANVRPVPGPADSAIFDLENGNCIADDMSRVGCRWVRADKSPGSRRHGLEKLREMLANSVTGVDAPQFYVFDTCRHWIRTVPVLPRSEKDPDDSDPNAEDHAYDGTRYRVFTGGVGMLKLAVSGV